MYRHVVLVFKLGEGSHQGRQAGDKKPGKYLRDKVYVKLFKNVPTVDLEMLFPDTDIQIKLFDKMKVILPLYGRGEFPESSEKKDLFIKRRYDYSVLSSRAVFSQG